MPRFKFIELPDGKRVQAVTQVREAEIVSKTKGSEPFAFTELTDGRVATKMAFIGKDEAIIFFI